MSVEDYLRKIRDLNHSNCDDLNQIIDQLNILSPGELSKDSEIIGNLLFQLAKKVPAKNDHILSKFCSLLCYLFERPKVKISFSSSSVDYLSEFLSLKISSCGAWVLSDVLIALTTFLNNTDKLKFEIVSCLLTENSVFISLLENNKDTNVQCNAFFCLFALVKNLGETALSTEILDLLCKKCLFVLKDIKLYSDVDILHLKILVCALKNLQLIFSSKNAALKNVGEMLGALKNLLFYGLPGQTFMSGYSLTPSLPHPEATHLLGSQSESDASHPKLRKQKKSRRKVKKSTRKAQSTLESNDKDFPESYDDQSYSSVNGFVPVTSLSRPFKDIKIKSSSSDSEFSDVDSQASRTKTVIISVRQNAYKTLQAVVKVVDQKTMFSYWSSFLPDHPIMSGVPSNPTIFTTILKDSASQVRFSALTLLMEMLRGSKQYLSIADGRSTKRTAFTSLSSILASIIGEIHRCLLLALLAENSVVLLIQILKCYAVLAENVPYNKLNKEILLKYFSHIKELVYHKDSQVQVACLTVFTALLNSDQLPDNFENWILSSDFDFMSSDLTSKSSINLENTDKDEPWIIEVCKEKIHKEDNLSVRVQSLQLLSSLTGKYFHMSKLFLPVIENAVLHSLNDADSNLQLHGVKLIDIIGRCLNKLPETEKNIYTPMSDLFLKAAKGPLIKCLTHEEHKTLQAAVCDCLSTLPSAEFASLTPKQQILYISILLGLASDSNASVRGAAIRCLGIFCLFPCLFQDASFYDDLNVLLVKTVNDSNVNVRFKASWALGNLSDTLLLNREYFLADNKISVQFFYSAGKACLEYSKDCDKVKANAVRALGNFLNFIPEQYLNSPSVREFIKDASKTLLSSLSATFMKVCWNACYALGSLMKNEILMTKDVINVEEIIIALVKILKSPNFKVRISAAQALSSLTSRDLFGKSFHTLWKEIIVSLQSSSEDVNFREIKHQENLCNQLCYCLCQMALLITTEDLSLLEKDIFTTKETLLTSMWKFGMHLTEEKSLVVSSALEHLKLLKSKNHDLVLNMLLDVLNQTILAYGQLDSCNSPQVFQSY